MSRRQLTAALAMATTLASGAALADDCVRGEPAPLFAASAALQAHHVATVSNHEAREHFLLAPGVAVDVSQGGCEYIVTTLRFSGAALGRGNAYCAAADLLRRLNRLHPAAAFDLEAAAATLTTLARRRPAPPFGSEQEISADGALAAVKLDGAGRRAGAGFVQVTLLRGPL
jgi:hypothetical protein